MGKFGYQSKDFRVKPIEVLNGNDRLLIDNDGYEIRIVANEEQIDVDFKSFIQFTCKES